MTTPIPILPLADYFPEIGEITALDKQHINIWNSPFLTLLTLPVKTRAFLTGALLESLCSENPAALKKEDELSRIFQKPLTLQHIMAYAIKVNELKKEREYFEIYNGLRKE